MIRQAGFPSFNAILITILGALGGIITNQLLIWIIVSLGIGMLVGVILQWIALRWGIASRWYRTRMIWATLIQIPVMLLFVVPYYFVVFQTQPKQYDVCCWTPADVGLSFQDVTFPAYDGTILAGWYIPPEEGQDDIVIVLHGVGADRLATSWHLTQLANAGYGVLVYDERALGESEGTMQSFGWLDVADVSTAIDFALAQPTVDQAGVGLVGLSLGGHIGIPATAQDERIRALWVDGIEMQHGDDFPEPRGWGEQVLKFYYHILDWMLVLRTGQAMHPPIIETLPTISPRPVFMVANLLTTYEERTNQRYAQAGDHVEIWYVMAGHIMGSIIYPDEYRTRMTEFFDRAFQEG